jgi:hypothetical protein
MSGSAHDEEYAILGANVVVELHSEAGPASRPDRRHADRTDCTSRPHQPQEWEMVADAR